MRVRVALTLTLTPCRERQGVVVGRRKGAEVEANPWLLRTKSLMLLTPSPEYMHPDMRITPEMVPKTLAITLTLALALALALTLTRSTRGRARCCSACAASRWWAR